MEEFIVIISHVALNLNIVNVKTELYTWWKPHLKLSVIKKKSFSFKNKMKLAYLLKLSDILQTY